MDKFKSWPLYLLPHHAISRVVFLLTRIESPLAVPAINWFIKIFNVNMDEAAEPNTWAYVSFNAFFTRALKDDARPIKRGSKLVCPSDGHISQAGNIEDGKILQAKGFNYTAEELLADQELAEHFIHGSFATVYLSPRDYHRVHMPCDGTLEQMIYVPGRLFSVAQHTVRSIPRLFARNERAVCVFDTDYGKMALVLVGAINVAAIETVWAGLVTPKGWGASREQYRNRLIKLKRGEEMGRFNMGSTVIVLTEKRVESFEKQLTVGQSVQMGERFE